MIDVHYFWIDHCYTNVVKYIIFPDNFVNKAFYIPCKIAILLKKATLNDVDLKVIGLQCILIM